MLDLITGNIDGVSVVLKVDESIGGDRLGGQPLLFVDGGKEVVLIGEVDTLCVIKAIATSTTLNRFKDKVDDTWMGEKCVSAIESVIKSKSGD